MTQMTADKKKSSTEAHTFIRRLLKSAFICVICGLLRGLWIPTNDPRTSLFDDPRLTTR